MITESLKTSKAYLYRIRSYVWASLFIFTASLLFGYVFAQMYPEYTAQIIEEIREVFGSIAQQTPWETFLSIFDNNLEKMLAIIGLGIFAGLSPLVFLIENGFILGLMAFLFAAQNSLPVFLLGIIPHGIIEIPCMLFSGAIGLKLGKTALWRLFGSKSVSLTDELAQGTRFAVTFIIPLLLIAALIEAYITPYFIAFGQLVFLQ